MQPGARRWGAVLLAVAAGMLAAIQVGKVPPTLNILRAEFGLSLVLAGWVASSVAAIGALCGIASGILADRLGRRRLAACGVGFLAIGSLLGALARGGEWLLIARLIEGAGFVTIVVSAPALVAEAAPAGRQRLALGLWATYMPAGMALVLVSAPAILGPIGWRGLWFGLALLSGLFLLAFLKFVPARLGRPAARLAGWRDIAEPLRRPGPWLLGFCFTFYAMQWVGVMTFLPSFILEEARLPLSLAAPLTALVVLVNVPGNLAGGLLLQRGAPRWLLIAAAQLCMGAMVLGMFAGDLPIATRYAMAVIFSLVGGILPAAVLAGAPSQARSPGEIGAINGIIVQSTNIGSFSGPPALAFVVATFGGWSAAGPYLAGCAFAGLLLALMLRRLERPA